MSVFQESPRLGKPARSSRNAKDMAYSMLALLIPIALMVILYRFLGGESPTVIDPSGTYAAARNSATYQVLEPKPVPKGWHASTATLDAGMLRVGYAGPDDAYLQVTESSQQAEAVLEAAMGKGSAPRGTAQVNGASWQLYEGTKGDRALVLMEPNRTIVLAGRTPEAQLKAFAESLKP
ncbi:DUF4245 domain-containing protein [Longispora albida]|uniref:DUF4245 domain-containing protein n=1 Tax=Longispora albida TaxID=203523 RepID=UPI0012FAE3AF|nr:DUF4245 domain-containing protein [Longispora albida]